MDKGGKLVLEKQPLCTKQRYTQNSSSFGSVMVLHDFSLIMFLSSDFLACCMYNYSCQAIYSIDLTIKLMMCNSLIYKAKTHWIKGDPFVESLVQTEWVVYSTKSSIWTPHWMKGGLLIWKLLPLNIERPPSQEKAPPLTWECVHQFKVLVCNYTTMIQKNCRKKNCLFHLSSQFSHRKKATNVFLEAFPHTKVILVDLPHNEKQQWLNLVKAA